MKNGWTPGISKEPKRRRVEMRAVDVVAIIAWVLVILYAIYMTVAMIRMTRAVAIFTSAEREHGLKPLRFHMKHWSVRMSFECRYGYVHRSKGLKLPDCNCIDFHSKPWKAESWKAESWKAEPWKAEPWKAE